MFICKYGLYFCLSAFIFFSFYFISFAVDDSFIYLRYGKVLLETGEWNWNPGLPKIEAYTGILYAILGIIPAFLNFPPHLFLAIVGLIAVLLLSHQVFKNNNNKFLAICSLILIFCTPTTYIHMYSGLETPIFILFLYGLYSCFYKIWICEEGGNFSQFCLLAILLALVRSDGPIIAGILGIALLCRRRPKRSDLQKILVFLALGAAYFLLRYWYFGYLFPAPAYQKLITQQSFFFSNWASAKFYLAAFFPLLIYFIFQKNGGAILIIFSSIIASVIYLRSNLEMNFADRFFYQISIPSFLFLITLIKYEGRVSKIIFTFAFTVFFAAIFFRGLDNQYVKSYTYSLYNSYYQVGLALEKFKNKKYTLLMGDVGILPFTSGWYVYDYMGLANYEVAKNGVNFDFLSRSSPDLIIVYSDSPGKPAIKNNTMNRVATILKWINQNREYEYVNSFTSGNYYNAIFIKRKLIDKKILAEEINGVCKSINELFEVQEPFNIKKILGFTLSGKWLQL